MYILCVVVLAKLCIFFGILKVFLLKLKNSIFLSMIFKHIVSLSHSNAGLVGAKKKDLLPAKVAGQET